VTGVSDSVFSAVGLPKAGSNNFLAVPSVYRGQPALSFDGKPGALFIGAEFCPYCAAERWPIIVAFSRFGTFSGLKETFSSPWDTYPATPTFSFYRSSYTSSYLGFRPIESESNDTGPDGAGRHILEPLSPQEANLWAEYDSHFGVPAGFPFLDIGNETFVTGPSYNPSILSGFDQSEIANDLTNPNDPATQDIVGTANYLTAAICSITGGRPSSVCSSPVVARAAGALGLG